MKNRLRLLVGDHSHVFTADMLNGSNIYQYNSEHDLYKTVWRKWEKKRLALFLHHHQLADFFISLLTTEYSYQFGGSCFLHKTVWTIK